MEELIEVKTAELSGAALDWAVGIAEEEKMFASACLAGPCARRLCADGDTRDYYSPSTCWSQGGPLISEHGVSVDFRPHSKRWDAYCMSWINDCETPLIAACRAIVAAKLGDSVMVPRELVGGEK